jgi:hypothetical protein
LAKSAIGAGLESLLAAGHVFTLDQAQEAALKFVVQVAGEATTDDREELDRAAGSLRQPSWTRWSQLEKTDERPTGDSVAVAALL